MSSSVGTASSRGTSFTRRTLGLQTFQQSTRDDFFLSYLKEMYKEQVGVQSSSPDRGFFEWVPDGNLISAVPTACLPETFEKTVERANLKASEFGRVAQEYFNRCGKYLSANATGGLMGLIDFAMASYPFIQNSRVHPMVFTTKDGRHLNGFIGVKDEKPRPWVIYKCGVFCAAETEAASLKNYMIHLFDQSPFNVIFLGNRTGTDYIKSNRVFNFGGFFESQDFFDMAEWLRYESPYAPLVSSVHVVGVSLAGSAAYLTEQRLSSSDSNKMPLIQSVSSLCAVSDLRPTVENMYGDSLKGFIFSRLTWYNLEEVRSALTNVDDLIGSQRPKTQEFPNLLGKLAARFIKTQGASQFGHVDEATLEKEFWGQSQYSAIRAKTKVPLFVWASKDDSVVDFEINTGNLQRSLTTRSDENLGVVGVPMGEHCGFATAYGYPVVASMLRSFILTNSPEFAVTEHKKNIPIDVKLPPMLEGERIIRSWWSQSHKQDKMLSLNIEIYGADDSLCPEEWAFSGPENCRRVVQIDFKEDSFARYGFYTPVNLIETEALVRELNGRTSLRVNEQNAIGAMGWPNQVHIRF